MTVRTASAADVENILSLIRATPDLPQWSRDSLAVADGALGIGPMRRLFVAAEGDEIAGFVQTVLLLDEADLEGIAVWPGLQRQGLGRLLLRSAMQAARSDGATILRLDVRPSNRAALRLYESEGMTRVGLRRGYYANPIEDAVLLQYSWAEGG